jgi:hypothetical protein
MYNQSPTTATNTEGRSLDPTLLSGAMSALSIAKELGKAAIGVRDFNEVAPIISKLNDQLLNAQESLFKINAQVFALQQENFESAKKLREMEETVAERKRYAYFELSPGIIVYRANITPVESQVGEPSSAEPLHYLCQPCFDSGVKAVLMRHTNYPNGIYHRCPICKANYLEKKADQLFHKNASVPFVRDY